MRSWQAWNGSFLWSMLQCVWIWIEVDWIETCFSDSCNIIEHFPFWLEVDDWIERIFSFQGSSGHLWLHEFCARNFAMCVARPWMWAPQNFTITIRVMFLFLFFILFVNLRMHKWNLCSQHFPFLLPGVCQLFLAFWVSNSMWFIVISYQWYTVTVYVHNIHSFCFEPLALRQQLSFPAINLPKTLFLLQERAKREKIEQWSAQSVLCHFVSQCLSRLMWHN